MDHLKLLCIVLCMLNHAYQVYADWTYPDISIVEGGYKGDSQGRRFIGKIKSDNKAVVKYTLSGEGVTQLDDGSYRFEMSEDGKMYQINVLDRERKDEYTLTASAFNGAGGKAEDDVDLKVIVVDINDLEPVFKPESLEGTVPEAAPTGQVFMTVVATDGDDPSTYNADVRYSIASDDEGLFFVEPVSGGVSVVGELDYEKSPEVTFKVIAEDGGGVQPGLKTTAEVTVKVTDSNDHAPVFDAMPDKSLSELSPLKKPLYDMFASDIDEGPNKRVYFDITSGNDGGVFDIVSEPSDTGKSKGQLQLVKPLDFESGKIAYTLTIRAYNKEASNKLDDAYISTATLKIKVTDENEAPIFINTPYSARVTEGDAPPEPVPLFVTVEAKDYDFGGNQSVTYSVNDPEKWFAVDPESGLISRYGAVDREAQSVNNGVYILKVVATDNYDNGEPASGIGEVEIIIGDINDNPPTPVWGPNDDKVKICEKPVNDTVKLIKASDPDSPQNGPEFFFRFDDAVDRNMWGFRKVNAESHEIISKFSDYGLDGGIETITLPFTITDSGTNPQTGTSTLTVTVCACDDEGNPTCDDPLPLAGGVPIAVVIAIIALLLLIIILVIAVIVHKRRQATMELKEPFFDDEDDVRESVQVYQEEGGEEDHQAYDLSALRAPLMEDPNQPVRIEKPLQQAARRPRGDIPDDIGDYIGDAKDLADADPSAPPFDSLLVFDFEGAGSDAGSLSSINTATTDGSMDYDYLNNWGPRFNKLANMYNDGSDSD